MTEIWNPTYIEGRLEPAENTKYHLDLSVYVNPLAVDVVENPDRSQVSYFEKCLENERAKSMLSAFRSFSFRSRRQIEGILNADNVEEKLTKQDEAFMQLDGSQSNDLVWSWASGKTKAFASDRFGIIKLLLKDSREYPDTILPVYALPSRLYDLILNGLKEKRSKKVGTPVIDDAYLFIDRSPYIVCVDYTRLLIELTSLITETNGSAVPFLKDLFSTLESISTAFYKMITYSDYNKNK